MVVRFLSGGHKQRGYAVTATAAYSLYGVMRPIPARRLRGQPFYCGAVPHSPFYGAMRPIPAGAFLCEESSTNTLETSGFKTWQRGGQAPSRAPRFLLPSVYFTTKRVVNKVSSLEKLLKKIVKFTATKNNQSYLLDARQLWLYNKYQKDGFPRQRETVN